MCGFVRRRLVVSQVLPNIYRCVAQTIAATHLDLSLGLLPVTIRSFSTETERVRKDNSFTVSYLINSCGLSREGAESASKFIKLQSTERPDAVLKVLKNHGFTDADIAKAVRMRPRILFAHPERTILAKFQFFNSIGVIDAMCASVCSSTPAILGHSLEKLLVPNYKFLKSVLLSDDMVIKSFTKKSWLFQHDLAKTVSPKLVVLRELGMPESSIALILTCDAPIVLQKYEKFDENVKKAIKMGFDPRTCRFIHAMQVFAAMNQSTLEHKLNVLRKWGWSDDVIMSAFRRCPIYLNASESKIMSSMDFLVNKMGWQITDIASYPDVFLFSLEKRVIPRCLVIRVLQSKGLVEKNIRLSAFLRFNEETFLGRFVCKYLNRVPGLLQTIYERKASLQARDMNINVFFQATLACQISYFKEMV